MSATEIRETLLKRNEFKLFRNVTIKRMKLGKFLQTSFKVRIKNVIIIMSYGSWSNCIPANF